MNKSLFVYTFIVSLVVIWGIMMAVTGFFQPRTYDSAVHNTSPQKSSTSTTNANKTIAVILPNTNTIVNVQPTQATYTGFQVTSLFVQFGYPVFLNRPVFEQGGYTYLTRGGGWTARQWQFHTLNFLLNVSWIGLISYLIAWLVDHKVSRVMRVKG